MDKRYLILKYFQKKDLLTVKNRGYQQTISSLFQWLTSNDKITDDRTSKYFPDISCKAKITAKEDGIAAGIEEIEFLLKKFTLLSFKSLIHDSSQFKNGDVIAEIKGKSHEILAYERTILNILQRLSGIATETSSLISLISPISQIQIAATRKTPWMSLDKKAVAVGGGLTHRLNLSDGILIKDNHLALTSIEIALKTPRGWSNIIEKAIETPQGWPASASWRKDSPGVEETEKLIEIEVTNAKEAISAIRAYQEYKTINHQLSTINRLALLLDNFSPSRAKSLLSDLRNLSNLPPIIIEASGGIDENNILGWSKTGVDIISLGSLTHSTHAVNLSLEFVTK